MGSKKIVDELTSRAATIEKIDFAIADRLIVERLRTMESFGA